MQRTEWDVVVEAGEAELAVNAFLDAAGTIHVQLRQPPLCVRARGERLPLAHTSVLPYLAYSTRGLLAGQSL